MANILCGGPGPHIPASGILGTSDQVVTGMRCPSPSCVLPVDPGVANFATLQQRAQAALTANAAFVAIATPTNAQVVAQVTRLTKECNALIRLFLALLADVSDTA